MNLGIIHFYYMLIGIKSLSYAQSLHCFLSSTVSIFNIAESC